MSSLIVQNFDSLVISILNGKAEGGESALVFNVDFKVSKTLVINEHELQE